MNKKKTNFDKDKDKIEEKIYELLYSKALMSYEELMEYLNISKDDLDTCLLDLIEKEVIIKDNNKYKIK